MQTEDQWKLHTEGELENSRGPRCVYPWPFLSAQSCALHTEHCGNQPIQTQLPLESPGRLLSTQGRLNLKNRIRPYKTTYIIKPIYFSYLFMPSWYILGPFPRTSNTSRGASAPQQRWRPWPPKSPSKWTWDVDVDGCAVKIDVQRWKAGKSGTNPIEILYKIWGSSWINRDKLQLNEGFSIALFDCLRVIAVSDLQMCMFFFWYLSISSSSYHECWGWSACPIFSRPR